MSEKQEPIFPKGLIFKAPRDGAPNFVKGSISIKRAELIGWLNTFTDEWISLDLKESKQGKYYAQLNTFKPKADDTRPGIPETHSANVPF